MRSIKCVLIFSIILSAFSLAARADVCSNLTKQQMDKAVSILRPGTSVLLLGNKNFNVPDREFNLSDTSLDFVQQGDYYLPRINGEEVDLVAVFVPWIDSMPKNGWLSVAALVGCKLN